MQHNKAIEADREFSWFGFKSQPLWPGCSWLSLCHMNNSITDRLRVAIYLSWLAAIVIPIRINYEATFLTWERGPQMIGFSFMHTYGIICFLAALFLAAMTLISAIEIVIRLFGKSVITKRHILILAISLFIIALNLIPYRYAQSIMIYKYGLPEDVKGFFEQKAFEGDLDNMELLLKKGFKTDSATFSKSLYMASDGGHINVIEFSLQNGANINWQTEDSKTTPLMIAGDRNQIETVKFLLGHGADPHLKDKNGLTALDMANRYNKKEIVELLRKY